MKLRDNPDEGRKVWLSESEVDRLTNYVEDPETRIALRLMAECGLRTKEVMRTRPADVREIDGEEDGYKLRVWEGKGDKYRETWIPEDLAESIRMFVSMAERDIDPEDTLLGMSRRTLQRRIETAREDLEAETGDEGWQYVSAHDLRRTWGTQAIEAGVIPTLVMQAGGWEDFKTFQEHYMGVHGDSVLAQEASKVIG